MQVPFLDLKAQNQSIWTELHAALNPVLAESQFILGPTVARFEEHFAAYLGARQCVGVNSGTSALHMALLACGVGPGDEVITTPATWISTSWAISYVGATPVFVDIDPITYTLDPRLVEQAITPRTRAILPVHLYGQAADLESMTRIANEHGLVLVENAAQAHGAIYRGRHVGTFGKASCFSFHPSKNLGAFGEGGAVVTDDDEVASRICCLRDHAQRGPHQHVEIGFNTRMEAVQAAVLDTKLPHLDAWNAARASRPPLRRTSQRPARGDSAGGARPGVPCPASVRHSCPRLEPRGPARRTGRPRRCHGHTLPDARTVSACVCLGYQPGDFPVAEDLMRHCLSLPLYPEMTEEQLGYIGATLQDVLIGVAAYG
jgi:dTDP-4-amino-4,6-dideoxygalactose transaminase